MTTDQVKRAGYIGLGNIGRPAAAHLVQGGFEARVYDIDRAAVDELAKRGAVGCASLAELAGACEHIGVCVVDDAQVESVLHGKAGVLAHAAPGTLVAIHSTVTHRALLKWAEDAAAQGITLIDAAISGGARGAEAGTLCYMVGGAPSAVARARPFFETSAESVIHAGALGAGMLLKLCNNLVTYAEFLAMSEAARLAEAGGLSVDLLREVGKSNGVVNETMHSFISNRNALAERLDEAQLAEVFGAFGKLGEKDLECALQSARELGVRLPATERLRKVVYDLFINKA